MYFKNVRFPLRTLYNKAHAIRCWISKATNTQSECVMLVLTGFPLQQ